MKRYLLPENGQFYKANLHCHSTVSDGCMTPEEIKAYYMERGYSVVAFTDHEVLIPHPELRSEDFLPMNGFETGVDAPGSEPWENKKLCHICFVALREDLEEMPFHHRSSYVWGNAANYLDQVKYGEDRPDYVREYSHAGVSDMMRLGREAGFFVTYNHPTWSREDYPDYIGYRGMHAMEILNYGCWVGGYQDYNPRVYDDLLKAGERIFAIATDDNHGYHDACGGWTMIKAESLTYDAIARALENGDFYASGGPEIFGLWVEDNRINVSCSKASRITCTYGSRRAGSVSAIKGGSLTHAAFPVRPNDGYVRITVVDERGRCADTNAYLAEEIYEIPAETE